MKYKICCLLILLTFCFAMFGQDSTKVSFKKKFEKFKHEAEIGINATKFTKQILSLSTNSFPTLPYDLTYKSIFYNSFAARTGIGFTYNNISENIVNSTIPRFNKSQSLSFRAGLEYQQKLNKHFAFSAGIDYIKSTNSSETISVFEDKTIDQFGNEIVDIFKTTTTTKSNLEGLGPVIGLYYNFSKRLSLYTEMPIYYSKSVTNDKVVNYSKEYIWWQQTYEEITEEDITTVRQSAFSITIPVTLYLTFRF